MLALTLPCGCICLASKIVYTPLHLQPNTELSKASTAGASSEPPKINLFEEEEELDEIEQLRS